MPVREDVLLYLFMCIYDVFMLLFLFMCMVFVRLVLVHRGRVCACIRVCWYRLICIFR